MDDFEEKNEPFILKHLNVFLALIFLLAGWLIGHFYGEESTVSVIAYIGAMVVGGYHLFYTGIKNLFSLKFDMKTLMTIAIIGAAAIGEWGEGATVVILFAISEILEMYSMDKARNSIRSLINIAPKEAIVRRGLQELIVHVAEIQIDDIMIVKPGQKIAMDGIVVKGTSMVNQAAITGESVPIFKEEESDVFAGTLNEEGHLQVRVTKRVDDTTIAKIIHLVEEAQAERAPTQAFVDRFAKYYTPLIMLIAFAVMVVPPLILDASWNTWLYQGLAVLVVGCPCALVVSTPVAIVTAIGNAAKNGVLIKGGIHLEEMGAIKAIAFDKTGTLTKGIPAVTDFLPLSEQQPEQLLKIIAALENKSQHPLAAAIIRKSEESDVDFENVEVEEFLSVTGKGIKGEIEGVMYFLGSPGFIEQVFQNKLAEDTKETILKLQNSGKTVMVASEKDKVIALIAVADEVRETSKNIIEMLHKLGIQKTIMLTGDNQGTANAIGKQVGVTNIEADLLPQDKLTFIKKLTEKYHKVAMVGDGINDAPALAASTVGIAMGGAGTDTALETADIVLMGDDLNKLPFAVKLSRKALMIIKQNITFSLAIKLLALLLVIPGWLTLWIAIFADMGATLLVTLNSLRLLRVKEDK